MPSINYKLRLPHTLIGTIRQEIRELYASVAFADMATALAVLFEPIILYKVIGLNIMQILLFMASVYAIQAVLLPLGAKIGARLGYMHAIFFSIPFMVLYWMLLYGAQVDFNLLLFAPVVYGIEKALFWPSFHATAARYINGKPSKQHDFLYGMVMVMRIIGPALGGVVGYFLGLRIVLLLAAAMYMTSVLPLLVSKEIYAPTQYYFSDTWKIYKTFPRRFLSYIGLGEEIIILTIWPILIYLILGNVAWTGIVVSLSAILTSTLLMSVKRIHGLGNQRELIKIGTFVYSFANLARLAVGGFYGIFMVDALGRSTKELITIPFATLTYERADRNGILSYVVFFQQSAALGKFLAATLGAIVFGLTGSLVAVFILAGFFTLLYMLA